MRLSQSGSSRYIHQLTFSRVPRLNSVVHHHSISIRISLSPSILRGAFSPAKWAYGRTSFPFQLRNWVNIIILYVGFKLETPSCQKNTQLLCSFRHFDLYSKTKTRGAQPESMNSMTVCFHLICSRGLQGGMRVLRCHLNINLTSTVCFDLVR
jgi:hypothetical protein